MTCRLKTRLSDREKGQFTIGPRNILYKLWIFAEKSFTMMMYIYIDTYDVINGINRIHHQQLKLGGL
jgi:hypothetical protein